MNADKVIITKEYLSKHATKRGAYTKKQINALGLDWMPDIGWQSRLIGTELSLDKARIFETENVPLKSKKIDNSMTPNKAIQYLLVNVKQLSSNDIVRLRNIESMYLDMRKK